jgi:hypothetical protein
MVVRLIEALDSRKCKYEELEEFFFFDAEGGV